MTRILSPAVILVLGAGYIGAKVAQLALARGEDVVLADNWHTTRREQAGGLGARVETSGGRGRGRAREAGARGGATPRARGRPRHLHRRLGEPSAVIGGPTVHRADE